MDIATQAEVLLREAGYETWRWAAASPPVICFENATLIGFLHVYDSAEKLLEGWESSQAKILARYSASLRQAGSKAWNVYSLFLSSERNPERRRDVERLEEDFRLTRKIARIDLQLPDDLRHALMPLLPVKAQPKLAEGNLEDRLRARAKDIAPAALEGFLRASTPEDVARMLRTAR
jgi:hypothetical protein